MNNSRWRANRIGLIDFWYYDEEEFYFLDGRILLRGANGSGKSVTMQSFIPLILDGNMRPERLDPFGSRARKMENYLLEEGDGREERTGYLFMEVKRQEEDVYLTLGIGMRARINKKMDVWYFCLTDGRRMGQDFFLYKDKKNKITLTKQELKNRVGEGGKVFETQKEYAQEVNKLLFGFETNDEYKEMLDLLIQLRTPKLSKDFKPSIINEILSNSLQTLSEDDLRPLSEAIENMDALKTNLDTLKDSVQATKQIEKVYNQYNQAILYQKASLYLQSATEYEDCTIKEKELNNKLLENEKLLEDERKHYEALEQERKVLSEEKKSLDQSDATRLKEQEQEYQELSREFMQSIEQKETQKNEKKIKGLEIENKIKKQEDEMERSKDEIQECLDEMEACMEENPFDEFDFLKKEIIEGLDKANLTKHDFQSHKQLFQTYVTHVEEGIHILEKEKKFQKQYDESLKRFDEVQSEKDVLERELLQYENLLHETKSELTERVYRWERENSKLKLPEATLQQISRNIEKFKQGQEYSEIKEVVREHLYEAEDLIRIQRSKEEAREKEIRSLFNQKQEELRKWNREKDSTPDRVQAVKANRKYLVEKNIPHLPFYQIVNLEEVLEREQLSYVEEALLNMGILDALIVPEEYKEQVLSTDKGLCDKYIFGDVEQIKENLLTLLTTWIDKNGNYKLSVLEGTITKEYEAKYIGVQARENFRKQQIERLTKECEELEIQLEEVRMILLEQENTLKQLQQEWKNFPSGEDLKTAAKECEEKERELTRLTKDIEKLTAQLMKDRKDLEEVRLEVQKICAKSYLKIRLDVFQEALKNLKEYREHLTQLEIIYRRYQDGIVNLNDKKAYLESIDLDLDNILYELNKIEKKLAETKTMIRSVQEQLALTNYEEIRARLDFCIERLRKLPKEQEASTEKRVSLQKDIEQLKELMSKNEQQMELLQEKTKKLEEAFDVEYQLHYVKLEEIEEQDDKKVLAKKICKRLETPLKDKKPSDFFENIQESYYQNRGALAEYNVTIGSLFENFEVFGTSMKRIDILAKYRGVSVHFNELSEKLVIDMEEQSRLLNDKDRELFEEVLADTLSKKIRARIQASKRWVEQMNTMMESMRTSSGLKLSLKWKNKRAEKEEQLDTRALVELLQKDVQIMKPEEVEKLSGHFRSKINEARNLLEDFNSVQSFHAMIKEVLDYRKWFEFQLESQKTGEKKKELTDRVFFTFSGGEKAMAMYVPLFSAVAAKYAGARKDALQLISLDEAFAGVDEMNIKDMFRLMVEFQFDFMLNSQILWGDYETVPAIAIYQLIRPENAKYVTVIPYVWNGKTRNLVDRISDEMENDA
jgi:hypothetical protein